MNSHDFYRLTAPTRWASPPDLYSYTSLRNLSECPLRWQLEHSRYGDLERYPARQSPASVEGKLIHELLDALFKQLALAGFPPIGSPAFLAVHNTIDPTGTIKRGVANFHLTIQDHPRASARHIKTPTRVLLNRLRRQFKPEYTRARLFHGKQPHTLAPKTPTHHAPADHKLLHTPTAQGASFLAAVRAKGVLTELELQHPELPFRGTIDLVQDQGGHTVLIDFKTGKQKPEHQRQLQLYALLWFRVTGEVPAAVEVRYAQQTRRFDLDQSALERLETELADEIHQRRQLLQSPPADPTLGDHCRHCDVKQFCDAYWASLDPIKPRKRKQERAFRDVELVVEAVSGDTAVFGVQRDGGPLGVVFSREIGALHGPFVVGEGLRIAGGLVSEDGVEVEVGRGSEVFHGQPGTNPDHAVEPQPDR